MACSACSALGVAITIAVQVGSSSSSNEPSAPGTRRVADGRDLGDARLRSIASMRLRPIQPTPRKPSRGFVSTVTAAPRP